MTTTWTPEAINRLRELWATGASCAAIGRELRTSKNSIVGKADRLGLPKRTQARNGSGVRLDRRSRPAAAVGLPLIDLAPHACRWPVYSDATQHRFCGARCAEGPYCAQHRAVAYTGFTFRPEMPPAEFNVARAA